MKCHYLIISLSAGLKHPPLSKKLKKKFTYRPLHLLVMNICLQGQKLFSAIWMIIRRQFWWHQSICHYRPSAARPTGHISARHIKPDNPSFFARSFMCTPLLRATFSYGHMVANLHFQHSYGSYIFEYPA